MKQTTTLFILFLTITLFSCSSDDETIIEQNDSSNKIDFDGETYQISGVNFEYGGSNDSSMALFPKGITFDDNTNIINGGNWFLEIDPLIIEDNTIEGTYKCGENVFGYFINNAQFVDNYLQPGKVVHEVNQNGTMTITKLGSEYEVIYNAFDTSGVAFTVYYKGPLSLL